MKLGWIVFLSVLTLGCASKEIESMRDVRLDDIVNRTQSLLEKQGQDNQKQRIRADEDKVVDTLSSQLARTGAKLEVTDGQIILWLPERLVFDFDKTEVTQKQTVEAIALFMQAQDTGYLRVTGHTDAVGESNYNQKLGMRRAAAVAKQLIESGINAERIIIASKGSELPRIATDNRERSNRRVELYAPIPNP